MSTELLQPVIALVLWTHVMWVWMYAVRIPAILKARMRLDRMAPRGEQMAQLPPTVRWKADNYNHLYEQPTLFYAVALAMALYGVDNTVAVQTVDVVLAWTYVGTRVVHSLWQSLINQIQVRFGLFVLSSLVLFALSLRAAWVILG